MKKNDRIKELEARYEALSKKSKTQTLTKEEKAEHKKCLQEILKFYHSEE
jgi:uncharacterized protein YnzC (UPF0291/DUF896 family)